MTLITGTIKDSGNTVLSGEVWVQLDGPLADYGTSPVSVLTKEIRKIPFTGGVLSFTLPESSTQNITYFFQVWSANALNSSGLSTYPIDSFHAIVPNSVSVQWSDLSIPSGISSDTIDGSIARLAAVLTSNQQYVDALRGGPQLQGTYSGAAIYRVGDAVRYSGTIWYYYSMVPTSGNTPTTGSAFWVEFALKGDPGGTGGTDTAYNATGWLGALWAPSANAIRNLVENVLIKASTVTAMFTDTVLAGNPSRSTAPTNADRSSGLATTAWTGTNFATLDSPSLLNNPSAPTQSITDVSGKLATTKFVDDYIRGRSWGVLLYAQQNTAVTLTSGVYTIVPFPTEIIDSLNAFASGIFTPAVTGTYRISCNLFLKVPSGALGVYAAGIFQGSTHIATLFLGTSTGSDAIESGHATIQLTAGVGYQVRAFCSGTTPTIGIGATIQNTLTIDRVNLI